MLGFPIGIVIKICWAALAPMFNLVCIEPEIYYGGTCFGGHDLNIPKNIKYGPIKSLPIKIVRIR